MATGSSISNKERMIMSTMAKEMSAHPAFNNANYKWAMGDFELAHRLGRGKFGRVFFARERRTKFFVALKTLHKDEIAKARVEELVLREIEIQSHLKHPNILRMWCWFHDDYRIYLVLEYASHGELFNHLRDAPGGVFPPHRAAKYLYQVADALDYCHQNGVIHRDIKPENLLLDFGDQVKVADFGWSAHVKRNKSRRTLCGTLDYLPPEMVKKQSYGPSVDNWCLGVLAYEFLCGNAPFEADGQEGVYDRIERLDIKWPQGMSQDSVGFVSALLQLDGKQRLALNDVMKHPWIVEGKRLADPITQWTKK